MKKAERESLGTVLLLHAAVVNRTTLFLLAKRLSAMGFVVHNPAYPNRIRDIAGCAAHVLPLFSRLAEESQGPVHVVGHSMGGLVARRLLTLFQPENFGRVVTLGAPHRGSPLADMLRHQGFYQDLFGPAGQELITGLPITWAGPWPPPYDIGLLAGTIPIGPGTLFISWESDGTVLHTSSQPPGGTDYIRVPATHTTLPLLKRTAVRVARFLTTGRFFADFLTSERKEQ